MNNTNELNNTTISKWLSHIKKVDNLSDQTVSSYTNNIKQFNQFISQNNLTLTSMKTSDIYSYIESLSEKQYAPRTINSHIFAIKSLFKYMVKVELISSDSSEKVSKTKVNKLTPKSLTLTEAIQLVDVTEDNKRLGIRNKLIANMLLQTGLRANELTNIKTSDIVNGKLLVMGKGSKERYIDIHPSLIEEISEYNNFKATKGYVSEYLFISERTSEQISKRQVQTIVTSLMGEIGRSELSTHSTRKTFVSLNQQNGTDIATLKELCGHANIQTTMGYLNVSEETKKKAIYNNPMIR